MIPGADLLRQAWDATKLVGAIIDRRKEKALVLSEERNKAVRKYKDKQANKHFMKQAAQCPVFSLYVCLLCNHHRPTK